MPAPRRFDADRPSEAAGRLRAVEDAFAGFGAALGALGCPRDRRIALDCARAALDRGAARLAPQPPALVAGTFWTEAKLHEGPSTTVTRVRHRDLGGAFALKTLADGAAGDPIRTRLLLREAAHQLRLRHPAVVAATTALRLDDGRPALLMELVEGPTLAARLRAGPLTTREALALARRLAEGLAAIHAAGLVHLDLTPHNVLLPGGDPARAAIADFGLSLARGGRRGDDEIAFAGTPGCAAPEQADPTWPADPRADLHALGATLARALDGAPAAPPGLAALIEALGAPDSERRPRDADMVVQALGRLP